MKVKLIDTQTGQTAESSGISTSQWCDGNWSCDCNRESVFGHCADKEQCKCMGCHRYLVIEAIIENKEDWQASLGELNSDYPPELLRKYGITPEIYG